MARVEVEIARLLHKYKSQESKLITIGTVESATGGKIADRLTSVPGSSEYFKGAIVAYSNEVKMKILGVKRQTLETHGAVSSQTAIEMARGGRDILGVDICISDTGIAGPSGGTEEKPVGLFYIGLAAKGKEFIRKYNSHGDREENKVAIANSALNMLGQYLSSQG